MRHLFANALHIFVIIMIALFFIGGILALIGMFDHWGSRYVLKRRRRRLLRDKNTKAADKSNTSIRPMHYYSNSDTNAVA